MVYRARWFMWRKLIQLAFWIAPRGDHRDQMILDLNHMKDFDD